MESFDIENMIYVAAFLFMVVNFILTTASLAMVHERVPDRNTYGPLPDVVLDNIAAQDWALNVSEVLIMILSNSAMVFIIFHKHRYVLYTNISINLYIYKNWNFCSTGLDQM